MYRKTRLKLRRVIKIAKQVAWMITLIGALYMWAIIIIGIANRIIIALS